MSLAALGAAAATFAAGQPPPEPVVEPTAAAPIVIAGKALSRGYLRHWMDIAAKSAPGAPRRQNRARVVSVLISARWIRGEATERGLVLRRSEVTKSLKEQRRESFVHRREFRRFLRDTGQTIGDIRSRIGTDLLTEKVRKQVTEGAPTADEQQARLDAFVAQFHAKWRARTACRPPWVSRSDCGDQVERARQ